MFKEQMNLEQVIQNTHMYKKKISMIKIYVGMIQ